MNSRLPLMPLLACGADELMTYNTASGDWQCALPHSTPHYLADERRWVLCPDDWIENRNVTTGRVQWTAPGTTRQ